MAHTNEEFIVETFDAEAFYDGLLKSLNLDKDSHKEDAADKIEILHDFCTDLAPRIRQMIQDEAEYHKGRQMQFNSESDKLAFWESKIAGTAFELLNAVEHFKSNPIEDSIDGRTRTKEEITRERALSDMLITIAQRPQDYGLLIREGLRIPDAIFVHFDKKTGTMVIDGLGESKLPQKFSPAAMDQLSETGSRRTITALVAEINAKMEGDFYTNILTRAANGDALTPQEENILPLLQLLADVQIDVAKDLTIEAIVPAERNLPDVADLINSDTPYHPQALSRLKDLFEIRISTEDPLFQQVVDGKIKFTNSMFSSREIGAITRNIMEAIDMQLDFPGEIVADKLKPKSESEDPQERVIDVLESLGSPEARESYLAWLTNYIKIGAKSVDLGKEQKKLQSEVKIIETPDGKSAIHSVTGISISSREFAVKDASLKRMLTDKLNAHLQDWYDKMEASEIQDKDAMLAYITKVIKPTTPEN